MWNFSQEFHVECADHCSVKETRSWIEYRFYSPTRTQIHQWCIGIFETSAFMLCTKLLNSPRVIKCFFLNLSAKPGSSPIILTHGTEDGFDLWCSESRKKTCIKFPWLTTPIRNLLYLKLCYRYFFWSGCFIILRIRSRIILFSKVAFKVRKKI